MTAITAGQVAIELRKLADALDVQPDAEIIKPLVHFYGNRKDEFMSTVRLMPRPLKKSISDAEDHRWARVHVNYSSPAIEVDTSVPQSLTCELVEPAKPAVYRCASILSEEADAAVLA